MEKQESSIIIYTTEDGSTNLQVKMENETVWLTQSQMAELFHKDQSVIARHISNVFKEGELEKGSNMQILHNTLSKYKPTSVYSLDVIISVGYRVKSKRGVQFPPMGEPCTEGIFGERLCHQRGHQGGAIQRAERSGAPYVACTHFAGKGY